MSSNAQDQRSQIPDLDRWLNAYANGTPVKRYLQGPPAKRLTGPAGAIWKPPCTLAKSPRSSSGDSTGSDEPPAALPHCLTTFALAMWAWVSIKDGIDLETAAGRLMANVLASVAAYENEVRTERIIAGQAVARANGKQWGGSEKGRRLKVTDEQITTIHRLHAEDTPITAIARATGLSRPTVLADAPSLSPT